MFNEIKIKGTKSTDKVFKCENLLVKVRLLKKEIVHQNKLNGPLAISLHLSGAICDKKGKAIPREGGGYCICPHSLTVPLTTAKPDKKAMKKGLEDALKPLILQTVNWHKNLKVLEDLLNDWENPKKEVIS